ncbi:hypothetical protein [Ferrovibrio sp.]|uniref:HVO_A0114 family putative DNA-binding protein n=1 Tax=Ferrovibrio sp. TaxID=1917215 RepID=UPI003D09F015
MTKALKQKQAVRQAKPALKIRANVSLCEALDDFGAAWKRAERGEVFDEAVLSFVDWEQMVRLMTPKRMELIRAVRRTRPKSIADLARGLKRDYKGVHADVGDLTKSGVLQMTDQGLVMTCAAIEVRIML